MHTYLTCERKVGSEQVRLLIALNTFQSFVFSWISMMSVKGAIVNPRHTALAISTQIFCS